MSPPARAFLALIVVCVSLYFADDFVREFGFRALPVGVLGVFGLCALIVKQPGA